jgi:copper resistance protein C
VTRHGRSRRLVRAVLLGGGLAAAALLPSAPAWAHSQLIRMTPADGSTVQVAPTRIVLVFDESIQAIGDAVVVSGPDGARVDDGLPSILDATVTERLHPLVLRGHYLVSYRIVSADGHPVTRTLGFTLTTGQAPASSSASPSQSPGATGPNSATGPNGATGANGGPAWPGVLVAVAAGLAAVWLGVRLLGWRRRT